MSGLNFGNGLGLLRWGGWWWLEGFRFYTVYIYIYHILIYDFLM